MSNRSNEDLLLEIQDLKKEIFDLLDTKKHFASILNHELRNKFTSINVFSKVLLQNFREYDADFVNYYLSSIIKSSADANCLLDNFVCWAKLISKTIEFRQTELDIQDEFDAHINLFREDILKKDLLIQNIIPRGTYVFVDTNMLRCVIKNLLSNAIKFSNKNGAIIITACLNDEYVEISICDNGIGISEKNIHNAFEFRNKINAPGQGNEYSAGIGLALCRKIVEKNEGRISMESVLKEGTTVKFSLLTA